VLKMFHIMNEWRNFVKETDEYGQAQEEIEASHPEATATAHHYHRKQTRRSGSAFVEHPKAVAMIIKRFYENDPNVSKDEFKQMMSVALLHDTIEDAHKNLPDDLQRSKDKLDALLIQKKISQSSYDTRMDQIGEDARLRVIHDIAGFHGLNTLSDVQSLSHDEGISYNQYVSSISDDSILIRVKLSDMLHNSRDLSAPNTWSKEADSCNDSLRGWEKYRCALLSLIDIHGGKPGPIVDAHWNELKNAFNID